mgnify:CR=1 FL=1
MLPLIGLTNSKCKVFPSFKIPAKTCYQITALFFINCNVGGIPSSFIINLDRAHAENVLAYNWPLTEIEASRTSLKYIYQFIFALRLMIISKQKQYVLHLIHIFARYLRLSGHTWLLRETGV